MAFTPGLPGSQIHNDGDIMRMFADIQRQLRELGAQNLLATAGIAAVPNGITVNGFIQSKRPDGTVGIEVDSAGNVIAYDATGTAPVARFGSLVNTSPGNYGVEVLVGSTWVQVGAQTTTWASVSGKPSTFPPSAHTHAGTDITSAVANATNATSATNAGTADGSAYAFNNNVAGTSYYAVWVGNDTGNHFGKNTSSIRYKENVREHYTDPANVLALTPVIYDRISSGVTEYGLIAEQVAEHFPELVQWFDGQIDNVRYDLLSVALLSVVKSQDARLEALETQMAQLVPGYTAPQPNVTPNSTGCNNPPEVAPEPLPYTIQPAA